MREYGGPKERLQAAQSADASADELRHLSQSEYLFVQEAVASNPNTPEDVLTTLTPASLASEDDYRIALALVRNPALPVSLWYTIGDLIVESIGGITPRDFYPTEFVDAFVRSVLVPVESLVALANPACVPKHIRRRIAVKDTRPELLSKLLEDPSEKVRSRARRALATKKEGHNERPPAN
jgi:hypothetical protein